MSVRDDADQAGFLVESILARREEGLRLKAQAVLDRPTSILSEGSFQTFRVKEGEHTLLDHGRHIDDDHYGVLIPFTQGSIPDAVLATLATYQLGKFLARVRHVDAARPRRVQRAEGLSHRLAKRNVHGADLDAVRVEDEFATSKGLGWLGRRQIPI